MCTAWFPDSNDDKRRKTEGLALKSAESWITDLKSESETARSRIEGRRGERRRAENQPMRCEPGTGGEHRKEELESMRPRGSKKDAGEDEERWEVTTAARVGEGEGPRSSVGSRGGRGTARPKRRPLESPEEEEHRWRMAARTGPGMEILSNGGRSSAMERDDQ